jgi:hypothetical protein
MNLTRRRVNSTVGRRERLFDSSRVRHHAPRIETSVLNRGEQNQRRVLSANDAQQIVGPEPR